MNRLYTLGLIGLAGLLASCGSSVTSSTQPPTNVTYSVAVSPSRLTMNVGDLATITAVADEQTFNSTPRPVSPAPVIKFYSSDTRVSISPAGQVCAGQWDIHYLNCVPALSLPSNPVTITAVDAAHGSTGSTEVFVHNRAANITLSVPIYNGPVTSGGVSVVPAGEYPSLTNCVSQNLPIKYTAVAVDSNGNVIPNCAVSNVAGCVNDLDYTWSVADSTVAAAGIYGSVAGRNPGVTSVYAKLNGTVSTPLTFATCPPAGITLASSGYTKGAAAPPYSTADLDSLDKGSLEYLTASQPLSIVDTNGNPLHPFDLDGVALDTLQLSFLSSNRLIGSLTAIQPFTAQFTATTSGRSILSVNCTPPACNPSVADFASPSPSGGFVSAEAAGFGYPIYSNLIGATVTGTTASTVLVTGTQFACAATLTCVGSTTPQPHALYTFDTESLALTHTISLANLPNSLVVAPSGTTAYVGSSAGLMVINLSTFESALQVYPIAGGLSTDVVTGVVLGVSPDSRYVLLSDVANGLVFLIDTTGTKNATRFSIPNIHAVTFAADLSNFWIAGDNGVYVYQSDTFVQTAASANKGSVAALAWAADGLSYFASGAQLNDYTTCNDQNNSQNPVGAGPLNLSSSAINGVPRIVGLNGGNWLDYSVTSSAQAPTATPVGNVCLATVKVNSPATTPSTLACTARQFSFSERLEQVFVSGVVDQYGPGFVTGDTSCANPESVIHGYDLGILSGTPSEITLSVSTSGTPTFTPVPIVPLSGGVLTDGRKLYVGTFDTTNGALLRRFDLASGTEDVVPTLSSTNAVIGNTVPASIPVIPSFVAVVPK